MPKKHKRITKHPKVTKEFLDKIREDAKVEDAYFQSAEGQAELKKWKQESEEKRMHGGKREGSGAKSIHGVKKVTLSLRITPQVKEFLSEYESASEFVDLAIRRTAAFKSSKGGKAKAKKLQKKN